VPTAAPQLSAVGFLHDDGQLKVWLHASRQKTKNLTRDRAVNLFTPTTPSPSTITTAPTSAGRSIWRTAAIAGVVAAVATTAIGAVAKAADVPLVVGDLESRCRCSPCSRALRPLSAPSSPRSCKSATASSAEPS